MITAAIRQHSLTEGAVGRTAEAEVTVVAPFQAASVVAGGVSSCAVTEAGVAYCWGDPFHGHLGNDLSSGRFWRPALVLGGHVWAEVVVGEVHACGRTDSGKAYCWGENGAGVLGAGGGSYSLTPLPLPVASTVRAIAAGRTNSCVLYIDATECWGYYGVGGAAVAFSRLTLGSTHACGIAVGGAALCWGANYDGELGDATNEGRTEPTPVSGGLNFSSLEAGDYSTCAVEVGGAAWCWGRNGGGQLGDGSRTDRNVPVRVAGSVAFRQVSVGSVHACGVSLTGEGYCWGWNSAGQLGTGTRDSSLVPTKVLGEISFEAISAGASHSCGLAVTGRVYCWGLNEDGQLGDNTVVDRLAPVAVWSPEE